MGSRTPTRKWTGFLFFAKATGPLAPATGSLIKKLQLVE
jgi:hypothetical protein